MSQRKKKKQANHNHIHESLIREIALKQTNLEKLNST